MAYIPMINTETGEIDSLLVAQRAETRACAEFGAPNPPPAYHREAIRWCLERAQSERRSWQRDHGLPVDGEGELVQGFVPSWGASGDGFGRAR